MQLGAFVQYRVEQLAVVAGDVLHISRILVAALDLEAAHARVDQGAQVAALVVVLHRQQVLLEGDDPALAHPAACRAGGRPANSRRDSRCVRCARG